MPAGGSYRRGTPWRTPEAATPRTRRFARPWTIAAAFVLALGLSLPATAMWPSAAGFSEGKLATFISTALGSVRAAARFGGVTATAERSLVPNSPDLASGHPAVQLRQASAVPSSRPSSSTSTPIRPTALSEPSAVPSIATRAPTQSPATVKVERREDPTSVANSAPTKPSAPTSPPVVVPSPPSSADPAPTATQPSSPPPPTAPAALTSIAVTAYGARGDGFTDDTAAFEATRDAAGEGGRVRVPPGTYIVASVVLSIVGQQWSLEPGATLKLRDHSNTGVIRVEARNVQLRGGKVDGNQTNQSLDLWKICLAVRSHEVIVEDVEVAQCSGWGIYLAGADATKILRNNIHDTTGAAIFVEGGTNGAVIDGNTVARTFSSGSGGIIVHGNGVDVSTPKTRITNNRVSNTQQIAIEVWGFAPDSHIEGNTTYGGLMGISVDQSDRTVVTGNSVTADPSRSEWTGLEIARSKNVLLASNRVNGDGASQANGIYVSNMTPYDNVITGNTIVRTSRPISLGGANRNRVTDNTIDSFSVYAVDVRGDDVTLTGNVITNGAPGSAGVMLDNVQRALVDSNVIRSCDRAVVLYQLAPGTNDGNHVTNNRFEKCTTPVERLGSLGPNNVIANNTTVP